MTDNSIEQNQNLYVVKPVKNPDMTSATLVKKRNSFIVRNGLFYEYYPISFEKVDDDNKRFIPIDKSPPVVCDGWVVYNGKIIEVTSRDILRRRIDVTREYSEQSIGANDGNVSESTEVCANINAGSNNQGVGATLEVEIWKDAELAFEEQIRELLYVSDSKEEWNLSFVTQPLADLESGPVENS